MSKRSFAAGVLLGAGSVIGLLALLLFAMPYVYLYTENSNFARLRKKSELNCETMPLHCLVRDGKTAEIEKYAEPDDKLELTDNWGRTALLWALVHDKRAIAHRLLTLNANPNSRDDNGISVFHHAVVAGKYDMADALLASGADIDGFNGNRYPETALHHCVMKNKPECVRYLIERDANMHLKDAFGYTVFERIRVHDHIDEEIGRLFVK